MSSPFFNKNDIKSIWQLFFVINWLSLLMFSFFSNSKHLYGIYTSQLLLLYKNKDIW